MSVANDLQTMMQQLEGYTDELGQLVLALGDMFAEVESYAADTDTQPGWTNLWMPSTSTPNALGFQAMLVGSGLPTGISTAAAVQLIEGTPNQFRGSPQSIANAIKATLTGSQSVGLKERTKSDGSSDDDALWIVTLAAETPDQNLVQQAIWATVPADINWYYTDISAATWATLQTTYGPSWAAIEAAAGPTWANIQAHLGFTWY